MEPEAMTDEQLLSEWGQIAEAGDDRAEAIIAEIERRNLDI